jgi:DNA-binding response OmpR family regulator
VILARTPGHLFAYCDLAERVLGYTCNEREARVNLRVHVMHLRRKLRADGCRCYDIVAVRAAGYRLVQIGRDGGIQNTGQQR